jgi:hypothetical protein
MLDFGNSPNIPAESQNAERSLRKAGSDLWAGASSTEARGEVIVRLIILLAKGVYMVKKASWTLCNADHCIQPLAWWPYLRHQVQNPGSIPKLRTLLQLEIHFG